MIVWVVGVGSDQRLHGYDGDTGAVIYDGGGDNELMSGTRQWNTGMVARGRIYFGADNKVYAFQLPAGTPTPTPTATPSPTVTPTPTPIAPILSIAVAQRTWTAQINYGLPTWILSAVRLFLMVIQLPEHRTQRCIKRYAMRQRSRTTSQSLTTRTRSRSTLLKYISTPPGSVCLMLA